MGKFIKKIILFILILGFYKLCLFGLSILSLTGEQNDFYGKVSKNTNKIILVGSSNIKHNIDFSTLNTEFKNYDVIGVSLNAPSGLLSTAIKIKKLSLDKNDIIIFCVPHAFYESSQLIPIANYRKSGMTSSIIFESLFNFPLITSKEILALDVIAAFKLFVNDKNRPSKPMDEVTFSMTPEVQSNPKFLDCWTNNFSKFYISSTTYEQDYLESLLSYLRTDFSSKIYFRYPPIMIDNYDLNKERLTFLDANFPMLNEFEESKYEYSLWYDKRYHLNKCGMEINTGRLIHEIISKISN
ncbi:MAG: hypothetical protein ACJASR_002279 [Psychroserpens sp.]|jgi:hypothetical protein